MLAPSSSLTEIHNHFSTMDLSKCGVASSIEEIQIKLEDETLNNLERFALYLSMYESRLIPFLTTRKALCNTYKVLEEVENSSLNLFSLYKMEIELVIEQFATAFYMQINSELGNNNSTLAEVRGVNQMLTHDLKELRAQIVTICSRNNAYTSFTPSRKRNKAQIKLEQVGSI